MIPDALFIPLLVVMALAAFFCRVMGYYAMRFVPLTPRVQAALKATPVSVMGAIIAMAAAKGGPTEWVALVVVVVMMKITHSDVGAAFCGIGFIALARYFGA